MPDPAVEAARRARESTEGRSRHVQRVAAAREALKPIKEKFEVWCATLLRDNHKVRVIVDGHEFKGEVEYIGPPGAIDVRRENGMVYPGARRNQIDYIGPL